MNLKYAFRFAAAAHPHLKASPAGRLLFASSVTGQTIVVDGGEVLPENGAFIV